MQYLLLLLGVLCTVGTWWFGLRALFTVPYEGPSTAAEEHLATVYLVVTLCLGLVVPVVGALVSLRTGGGWPRSSSRSC